MNYGRRRLRKLIVCALFLWTPLLKADQQCMAVDLRDSKVAPLRNQYFFDNGKIYDSFGCHAFSAANLIGQSLGVAVSAEDIALKTFFKLSTQSGITPDKLQGTKYFSRLAGLAITDIAVGSYYGYCAESAMEKHLIQDLHYSAVMSGLVNEARKKNMSGTQVNEYLDSICGQRIPAPRQQLKLETVHPLTSRRDDVENNETIKHINQILESGRFVIFNTNVHYLTIVGRTTDCSYVIQDSIDEEEWRKEVSPGKVPHFVGEDEIWSPYEILKRAKIIDYMQ